MGGLVGADPGGRPASSSVVMQSAALGGLLFGSVLRDNPHYKQAHRRALRTRRRPCAMCAARCCRPSLLFYFRLQATAFSMKDYTQLSQPRRVLLSLPTPCLDELRSLHGVRVGAEHDLAVPPAREEHLGLYPIQPKLSL